MVQQTKKFTVLKICRNQTFWRTAKKKFYLLTLLGIQRKGTIKVLDSINDLPIFNYQKANHEEVTSAGERFTLALYTIQAII